MDLVQYAQGKKVTITSPGNLLLVVGVIKEFMKVVTIGENQNQIMTILDELKKEWDNYIEEQSVVARALKTATTHFDYLEGRRRKALDRKFNVKDLETQLDKNPDKALDVSIIENVVEDEQEIKSVEEEREKPKANDFR